MKKCRVMAIVLGIIFGFDVFASSEASQGIPRSRVLYEQAVVLYEKIEQENAHIVQVNDIKMGYLDFGPKNGVPFIWAHGSGWTGYEILNVKDGLIASGYRVIAIDYRGHGKTQVSDLDSSIYDIADDIAALMDHLYISEAVVGGWSYGGSVATAFYDEYPERTLGLLLEDGGSSSHQQRWDERLDKAEYIKRLKLVKSSLGKKYATRYEAVKSTIDALPNITVDRIVNTLSQWLINEDDKWVHHLDRDLVIGDLSGFEKNAESRHPMLIWSKIAIIPEVIFRNLDIPITIIDPVSENDQFIVKHQNAKLKSQHLDLIAHEVYESTSHSAHLENPERFIENASSLLVKAKVHRN